MLPYSESFFIDRSSAIAGKMLMSFVQALLICSTFAISNPTFSQPLPHLDLWRENSPFCFVHTENRIPILVFTCNEQSVGSITGEFDTKLCFPTKGGEDMAQPCNDGDMTLFNGLLCSANIPEGCDAVVQSQDLKTGQWFRSPRRMIAGPANVMNSFSPDMAIGLYHWLVSSPTPQNKAKFEAWINWLSMNKRCLDAECKRQWPRFCPDDDVDQPNAEYGCTMRPGDLATLGVVTEKMGIVIRDKQIRELTEEWRASATTLAWISAHTNEVGYRLHLAASVLYLYKRLGIKEDILNDAELSLVTRQPKNPFFAFIYGDKVRAKSLVSSLCPANQASIVPVGQRDEWSWERKDSDEAWKRSMLWECIFISSLLQERQRSE
ncbi:hypothetical protein [Nitrosomonas oligotropha]|uniref:Uncharacterized protein n=1 Tax=Nitrosomonas oligotropha TaxID=42354 RepID=A0A1H8VEM7_9PROT|nr:hypothetical protein [Nitrosomonas oligotropha]SDX58767.1 hypothetical protein SAMN05216300_1554 [Nitrosomonas oligotropha]SEP13860.1 hypothetical protein SAMN05216333_1544 [Nitrosomonas oligotropha]